MESRGSLAVRNNCAMWESETSALFIRGTKVMEKNSRKKRKSGQANNSIGLNGGVKVLKWMTNSNTQKLSQPISHGYEAHPLPWRSSSVLYVPRIERRLETYCIVQIPGRSAVPGRLLGESEKGRGHLETTPRILDRSTKKIQHYIDHPLKRVLVYRPDFPQPRSLDHHKLRIT
jgi:hypothetical protein